MIEHHRLGEVVMLTLIDHLQDEMSILEFIYFHIFAFHACLRPVFTLRCLLVDFLPLDLAQARLAGGLAPQVMHLQVKKNG